jgi:Ricin-type beta-trefoil lectin domain
VRVSSFLALVTFAAAYGPVGAAADDNNELVHHTHTRRCLDANGGGGIYTLPCNAGNLQQWLVTRSGYPSGTPYLIRQPATGQCLQHRNNDVVTSPCNESVTAQQWELDGDTIRALSGGLCLDSNANGKTDHDPGPVYMHSCNGGYFQNWS